MRGPGAPAPASALVGVSQNRDAVAYADNGSPSRSRSDAVIATAAQAVMGDAKRYRRLMNLFDRIRRWWNPAQWRDDHPLSAEERAERSNPDAPDGYVEPQHGIGAESYDRVDVEREFRKP